MTPDQDGRRIGDRYRLLQPLGRGGMGVVWAAVDEVLGREVAVKEVIPPFGLTAEQAEATRSRSLREARAAARITSASAVKVYDVVEDDGRPWIVMERLDARPLSEIIESTGPLRPERVAEIATHLLDALIAAHDSGVLHRDVKPSNVMIVRGGRVVLTDFGIAALDGDPSITTTGVLIGSPAYIAPERAQGEPASPASDLWSLGCTMFAALEGRPPFARDSSLGTLHAVITENPLPVPSAGSLAGVLEGLLRKDPGQRMSAEDTQRMLLSVSVAAAPPPTVPARPPAEPSSLGDRTTAFPVLPSAPFPPQAQPPPKGATRPPAQPATRRRSGSRRLLAAAAAAGLVLGAIVAVAMTAGGDPTGNLAADPSARSEPASTTGGEVSQSSEPVSSPSTTDPTTVDPTTTAVEPTVGPTGPLPPGFTRYTDPTGFSVAVPDGWDVVRDEPRVDFVEPGGGRFLRVDQTDAPQPDPVADWENQEVSASERLPSYQRIRIEPVDYRNYNAADWEFTWAPADGPPLHVLNRNLITAPDQAYALYWSTPEAEWESSLEMFQLFADSFQPAG